MLILTRKKDEVITIGDTITLVVVEIRGDKVRLGINAPADVAIDRAEIRRKKILSSLRAQAAPAPAGYLPIGPLEATNDVPKHETHAPQPRNQADALDPESLFEESPLLSRVQKSRIRPRRARSV